MVKIPAKPTFMKMSILTDPTKNILASILILFVCVFNYSNSFHNPFLMDDFAMLTQNRFINDRSFLQLGFNSDGSPYNKSNIVYFRPVAHICISVLFSIFGKDPFGYHCVNSLFFYLSCLALFILIRLLTDNGKIALLGAILFGTHPINGLFVNYCNATGYSVLILTTNLSLIFSILATEGQKNAFITR